MSAHGDRQEYVVVVNEEEQYSIWFSDRERPDGWYSAGFSGSREECLAHVSEVWTDLTPKSARP